MNRWTRFGAAILLLLATYAVTGLHAATRPNVILICVDGCRADHLGVYGYPLDTSPAIDRLARQGVWFENNICQANESLFSHASLFASRYPSEIGPFSYMHFALAEDLLTLPKVLKSYGYKTAAFTGGAHISHEFGFGGGFDTYWDGHAFGTFYDSVPRALGWMRANRDSPMFVFLHGYDCHRPYWKPGILGHLYDPGYKGDVDRLLTARTLDQIYNGVYYRDFNIRSTWLWNGERPLDPFNHLELARRSHNEELRGEPLSPQDIHHIISHYDSAITYADTWLGVFFSHFSELGLNRSNTLVIVLADHGEDLMEHGVFNHRIGLQIANIHVPLIFWGAGVSSRTAGKHYSQVTENTDVMPTVLRMLDVPLPPALRGLDLSPLLRADKSGGDALLRTLDGRLTFTEGILLMSAVVSADYELIVRGALPGTGDMVNLLRSGDKRSFEFFSLKRSRNAVPSERMAEFQQPFERLREALLAKESGIRAQQRKKGAARPALDPHLRKTLQDNGYPDMPGPPSKTK